MTWRDVASRRHSPTSIIDRRRRCSSYSSRRCPPVIDLTSAPDSNPDCNPYRQNPRHNPNSDTSELCSCSSRSVSRSRRSVNNALCRRLDPAARWTTIKRRGAMRCAGVTLAWLSVHGEPDRAAVSRIRLLPFTSSTKRQHRRDRGATPVCTIRGIFVGKSPIFNVLFSL